MPPLESPADPAADPRAPAAAPGGAGSAHDSVLESEVATVSRARPLPLARSFEAWEQARELIFEGTQTYSKLPLMHVAGAAPVFARRAAGAFMWDVDGNRFLDLAAGQGAVLLGHAHPAVNRAVMQALAEGVQLSLGHPLELELARRLRALLPVAERVRFFKTGAEATAAAVRVARAVTGRRLVVRGRYHGWHDWTMAGTSRGAGIPDEQAGWVCRLARHDPAALEELLDAHPHQVAAVCVEPVQFEPLPPGALARMQAATHAAGALLVLDEVATGFRFGRGGVQAREGVVPDLAVFGKALANGLPLAVLAGRAELLHRAEGRVFISSTFAGETASLAAACAVLDELETPAPLERLEAAGAAALAAAGAHADLGGGYRLEAHGFPARFLLAVEGPDPREAHLLRSLIYQECVRRGVFLGRVCYPMACWDGEHAQVFTRAVAAAADVARAARAHGRAHEWLAGQPLGELPVE